jgi:5-methylcytosine-specific restriction endonuclease McrA
MSEIDAMKQRQQMRCACGCGRSLWAGFHVDHIVPLARGGTNGPENLQLLAPVCNLRKGAKL